MLLEVTTGCKMLNYIRRALRTASGEIGTKLAVTGKCWRERLRVSFSKDFNSHFRFPDRREDESRFWKSCVLFTNQRCTNKQ